MKNEQVSNVQLETIFRKVGSITRKFRIRETTSTSVTKTLYVTSFRIESASVYIGYLANFISMLYYDCISHSIKIKQPSAHRPLHYGSLANAVHRPKRFCNFLHDIFHVFI